MRRVTSAIGLVDAQSLFFSTCYTPPTPAGGRSFICTRSLVDLAALLLHLCVRRNMRLSWRRNEYILVSHRRQKPLRMYFPCWRFYGDPHHDVLLPFPSGVRVACFHLRSVLRRSTTAPNDRRRLRNNHPKSDLLLAGGGDRKRGNLQDSRVFYLLTFRDGGGSGARAEKKGELPWCVCFLVRLLQCSKHRRVCCFE